MIADLNNIETVDICGGNSCACWTNSRDWYAEVSFVSWDAGYCYNHCCQQNSAERYGWKGSDDRAASYNTFSC